MSMAEKLGRGILAAISQPAAKKGAGAGEPGAFGELVARAQPGAGAGAAAAGRGQGLARIATPEGGEHGFLGQIQALAQQIAALEQAAAPAFAGIDAASEDMPEALGQILEEIAAALGRLFGDFDAATGANALDTFRANLDALTADGAGFAGLLGDLAGESSAETPAAAIFAMVNTLLGLPQMPRQPEPAQGALATEAPASGAGLDARFAPAAANVQPGADLAPAQPWQAPWRLSVAGEGQPAGDQGRRLSLRPSQGAESLVQDIRSARPQPWHLSQDVIKGFLEAAAGRDEPADAGRPPEFAALISEHRALSDTAPLRQLEQSPAAQQSSGFARGIQDQIRKASFTEGRTRIELSPRGLGDIEIDVQTDDSGRLRVVVRAENPAVLHALRSDRDTLLDLLDDGGLGVEDGNFELSDFGGHGADGREQPANASGPRPGALAEDEAIPTDTLSAAPRRNTISGGRLDIIT